MHQSEICRILMSESSRMADGANPFSTIGGGSSRVFHYGIFVKLEFAQMIL